MRKPVFPRILFIALLYFTVFITLVAVQFSKRGSFTQKVGSFTISGHYRMPGENEAPENPDEFYLEGEVHVLFGGMDFGVIKGSDGRSLSLIGTDGRPFEALPERMIVSEDSAILTFPGGTELVFSSQYSGTSPELRITGIFSDYVSSIELPFKLQRRSGIQNSGDGRFIVNARGTNYSFGNSQIDAERRLLIINSGGGFVSYRAIPEQKVFSLFDFILPEAEAAVAYSTAITKWRDRYFPLWNSIISEQNNEDLVIALAGEALNRGTYEAAVGAVSSSFLRGNARTYESSVYLGGLDQAYRSLIAREREKISLLSRQINEKSLAFLLEPRVFEYLTVRGQLNLIETAAELVETIDRDILALDIVPGILEGYTDWNIFRRGIINPFEDLTETACSVISENIRRTTGSNASENRVFVQYDGTGDLEFNLRLGKALLGYAEAVQSNSWVGIGRSLILSALNGIEETDESAAASALTSAKLYRILSPANTSPRAVTIIPQGANVWAWTAAQTVSATQQNDALDITVNFPVGETHYMIIRGMRPFTRLRLYDMDFRTDPQFERYDSSGWGYNSQEQTLLLKMKHHNQTEHVWISFREEPRPIVVPQSTDAEEETEEL
jgi:hypothetical protein